MTRQEDETIEVSLHFADSGILLLQLEPNRNRSTTDHTTIPRVARHRCPSVTNIGRFILEALPPYNWALSLPFRN